MKPDFTSEEIAIALTQTPNHIEPAPQFGTLFRDDDLVLRGDLRANEKGRERSGNFSRLQDGEAGFGEIFHGKITGGDYLVELHGWVQDDTADFSSGAFSFNCHVSTATISLPTKCPANKCIVSCLAGPRVFGPEHIAVVLNVPRYRIAIRELQSNGRRSRWNRVSIEIEADQPVDESDVKKVLTALSFVSGRRVIDYETNFLSRSGQVTLRILKTPRVFSPSEYTETPRPPNHKSAWLTKEAAEQWSHLLSLTLSKMNEFPLGDVLTNVWKARTLALGWNLVFYASALEFLTRSWIEHLGSKRPFLRVSPGEFQNFLDEISPRLNALAAESPGWDRIKGYVVNANRESSAFRTRQMFIELEMNVGEIEAEIQNARHRFAHGVDLSNEEDGGLFNLANAAESLLNRTLLKIVGFQGEYIDYSTFGFPSRKLSDRLGGPKGDGKKMETKKP